MDKGHKVNIWQTDLEGCVNDFLNVTAKCSPSILISKPKFHFLVHIAAFIRRFGPAVMFSTERYESYNAVFRAASIYSNKLAPSRDIGWIFACMDRVKHIVTGGWWYDPLNHRWTCASSKILEYVQQNPQYLVFVGLSNKSERLPGHFLCSVIIVRQLICIFY